MRIKSEWNYVAQCKQCTDREECPYKDKTSPESYCVFELELYRSFMESLGTETLKTAYKLLAEQVVWNMIIAQRISRRLKFDGLQQEVKVMKDGKLIKFKQEHILKQGLHLDITRMLRLLKELKQTPKERDPKESKVVHEFKDMISDELKKVLVSKSGKTS